MAMALATPAARPKVCCTHGIGPPAFGIAAASSAKGRALINARTAPSTHSPISTAGDALACATIPGERRMPCPITEPTTAAIPKVSPSTRIR
nr:hypothetical protein [Novosphingobium sp. Gsoil 351]